MKLLVATRNSNKVREIRDKFRGLAGLELVSLDDIAPLPDVVEDGATFEENALKKARETARLSGLPSMADDSGLEVDALGGEPGVYSARYAGEGATDADRNSLLLEKMKEVPEGKRSARFVCVIAIAFPGGSELVARGICEGEIARMPRGAHGFGYDPVFHLPEKGKTMAEIPLEEKNRISHRALALEQARRLLEATRP
ncbi:MAG: XTP/dITP diphosphatase [Spirochaetes bacterium]|nr:XTP/dITP diphosphatase [Spirochaetota bacterium]